VKTALQCPELAGPVFDAIAPESWTHPEYAAVAAAVAAAGGAAGATVGGAGWLELVAAASTSDDVRRLLPALAVEALRSPADEPDSGYVHAVLTRLKEMATVRRVTEIKGRLQRMNPVEDPEGYTKVFGQLLAAEQEARALRERGIGGFAA
jgi:DNA primase